MFKKVFTIMLVLIVPVLLLAANGTITGKVVDKNTNTALGGANVSILGTSMGAATDMDGIYSISDVPPGTYDVRVTFIGYERITKSATISTDGTTTIDFVLPEAVISSQSITVFSSRAVERETPVAFSTIDAKTVETNLGGRDIPLVLDTTPSVYATQGGGGAGDARMNVRGFNQRNVAIMINGVPQNDMENGWLYWSNWDGLADVTSSIQMQRGLSAVNLATPSIGGAMNIITAPTQFDRSLKYKQDVGNDGFLKSTLILNSGLIDDKLAFTGSIVRKTGDGLIDKTWTDAWAYYFGASYEVNQNNRLEVYGMGAPQHHGQNLYKLNIAAYDHDFARDLDDYDPAALDDPRYAELGRKYNPNWNVVDPSYNGKQFFVDGTRSRYDKNFINERENFFHKPLWNLNWYSKLSDNLNLFSTLYYSGGEGGGTGTLGSIVWDYTYKQRVANWNGTIARNDTSSTGSLGILRSSRNNQWTIGAISKATYDINESLKVTGGIDWRTAEIEHYRDVVDLLGGDYYMDDSNDFWSADEQRRGLGDKVAYFNTNTVDWYGVFGQAEYSKEKLSLVGMAGYSMVKYGFTDHFTDDGTGNELTAESDNIGAYQFKGGASYRTTEEIDIYANAGYVTRVPIFDDVINDSDGSVAEDPENQKFIAFELGMNYASLNGKYVAKLSLYNTVWKDRTLSRFTQNASGEGAYVFLRGLDALHQGVELEAGYKPISQLRIDGAVSIGNWKYTDDVSGTYKDYSGGAEDNVQYDYYLKDLKVGDAPQTQFALMGTVTPTQGLQAQLVVRHYREHYAEFDPQDRTNAADRGVESWKSPSYTVTDFHASYDLPFNLSGVKFSLFAHVFNMFDAVYVQDAVDNSGFNGFDGDHDADDAEVYLGLPRSFNLGMSLTY